MCVTRFIDKDQATRKKCLRLLNSLLLPSSSEEGETKGDQHPNSHLSSTPSRSNTSATTLKHLGSPSSFVPSLISSLQEEEDGEEELKLLHTYLVLCAGSLSSSNAGERLASCIDSRNREAMGLDEGELEALKGVLEGLVYSG